MLPHATWAGRNQLICEVSIFCGMLIGPLHPAVHACSLANVGLCVRAFKEHRANVRCMVAADAEMHTPFVGFRVAGRESCMHVCTWMS